MVQNVKVLISPIYL
jgi:hypothetical protein